MKIKLLVIFFFVSIISILIFKYYEKEEENILYIGEKYYLNSINYNYYNLFLYDNITYKELINRIKDNDYIISKNKRIYLNQLIMNSDVIIIGANNNEYNKVCNSNDINIDYYNNKNNINKNELIKIISKISHAKVIILNNYCKKNNIN